MLKQGLITLKKKALTSHPSVCKYSSTFNAVSVSECERVRERVNASFTQSAEETLWKAGVCNPKLLQYYNMEPDCFPVLQVH